MMPEQGSGYLLSAEIIVFNLLGSYVSVVLDHMHRTAFF